MVRSGATAAVLLLMLCGCQSSDLRMLDEHTRAMIRQSWSQSVGHDSHVVADPAPLSDVRPLRDKRQSIKQPATRSPAAADLPARRVAAGSGDLAPDLLPSLPDDAASMDLEGLLAYAIENSREYRNQKESLFIAAINLLSERHLWGPRFFNTTSASFSGTPEAGDHDQALALINTFRATHRLPSGGEVAATALVSFVNLLHDAGGSEGQDATISLSARFPLLRGAGEVAREDLIQAERELIYAARTFERFRRQFLLDVATRYYDLIQQIAAMNNRRRQLRSFVWLAERIEALATAGREPLFEVQRAQQQVLFARNNLINSEEQYVGSLDAFKIFIGMPTTESLGIKPVEVTVSEPLLDEAQSINTALEFRLDLQTSADQVDDAHRRVGVAKNNLLPDLDVTAQVNFGTDSSRKYGGLDFDLDDSSYLLELRYDAPLDRRIEQLRYRRSLIDLERSHRSYTLRRDTVVQDVRRSIRQIQQARFTLALQDQNIEIARKRLRGVVLRLRSLGPRDFIEAEADLLEAENRRDGALRDLRVSILRYLLDTGQLRVDQDGSWQPPGEMVEIEHDAAGPAAQDMLKQTESEVEDAMKQYDQQKGEGDTTNPARGRASDGGQRK